VLSILCILPSFGFFLLKSSLSLFRKLLLMQLLSNLGLFFQLSRLLQLVLVLLRLLLLLSQQLSLLDCLDLRISGFLLLFEHPLSFFLL
jgi:hypothetical protein